MATSECLATRSGDCVFTSSFNERMSKRVANLGCLSKQSFFPTCRSSILGVVRHEISRMRFGVLSAFVGCCCLIHGADLRQLVCILLQCASGFDPLFSTQKIESLQGERLENVFRQSAKIGEPLDWISSGYRFGHDAFNQRKT